LAATVLLALLASRYAARFGVPILLVFLAAGMVAGAEGVGRIGFENYHLAQLVGVLALLVILFDGGFHTEARLFRAGLWPAVSLSLAGTLITAIVIGCFAVFFLHFDWWQGMLLGSVVSPTDAAAIFSSLRRRDLALKKRVQAVLEIESGSNDPPAVYLTLAFTTLLLGRESFGYALVWRFALQMGLGLVLGYSGGRAAGWLMRRTHFDWQGLYPLIALVLGVLVFAVTNLVGGSGFLAVYVAGIVLGNQPLPFKPTVGRFLEGIAWMMQAVMFVTLGLLVLPSRLAQVALPAIGLAVVLILVARPLAVWLSLPFGRLGHRERLLVSWAGLRGAVPIILAIYPLTQGLGSSQTIFDIVFFVVILSVLLQGTTVGWLAKRLHLTVPSHRAPAYQVELAGAHVSDGDILLFRVDDAAFVRGKALRDLPVLQEAPAMLIVRDNGLVTPRGTTKLEAGDYVYFYAREKDRLALERLFGRREPPPAPSEGSPGSTKA
jgi:cell volume regulation protein A